MRLLGGVLHGAEGATGPGGDIEGAGGVPAASDDDGTSERSGKHKPDRDRPLVEGSSAYARRSMSGAQFFSAMRPRSLRLALSTAFR